MSSLEGKSKSKRNVIDRADGVRVTMSALRRICLKDLWPLELGEEMGGFIIGGPCIL